MSKLQIFLNTQGEYLFAKKITKSTFELEYLNTQKTKVTSNALKNITENKNMRKIFDTKYCKKGISQQKNKILKKNEIWICGNSKKLVLLQKYSTGIEFFLTSQSYFEDQNIGVQLHFLIPHSNKKENKKNFIRIRKKLKKICFSKKEEYNVL